ncbi:GNAT family N-acetyltransferase [Nocardia alni]|uniref:GNAT family N-acetyltransferase n=1 Tax=Nocardia alni TaxID=2815723 RepID=UPI001C24140B|nr:GNAT family N-acetyltransferase [Nocardia alni]
MGQKESRPTLRVVDVEWDHPDAILLRGEMDAELAPRYRDVEIGDGGQALSVDPHTVVVTYLVYEPDAGPPIGHAALRVGSVGLEVKRMFVRPGHRGRGVAGSLLSALEAAARQRHEARVILQTGERQPEAIGLYERAGYRRIPIFPPYEVVPLSICFEKRLG